MFSAPWFRGLRSHRQGKPSAPLSPRSRRKPPGRYRLTLEPLEVRTLLSTVNWIKPAGGDWDTASNWSGGAVPGPSDDVVIDIPGQNNFTVSHAANVADAVNSLTSQDAVSLSGGSLSLTASSTINNALTLRGTLGTTGSLIVNGLVTWSGGMLSGSGTVYLDGGTSANPNVLNEQTLDATLVNNGYTEINGRVFLGSGVTLTNAPGATLVLASSSILPQSGATGAGLINDGTLVGVFVANQGSTVSVPFTNGATGLVTEDNANLIFTDGGVSSGQFVAEASYLGFIGNFSFAAATAATPNSAIDGTASTISFGLGGYPGGNDVVACPYAVTGETDVWASTVQFTGPLAIANDDLNLNYGVLDFTAAQLEEPLTFDNVFLHSVNLLSAADVHITGNAQLGGGTLSVGGTVYLDGGTSANPNVLNEQTLDATLVNNGYTEINGRVFLGSGVTLTNAPGATLVLASSSILPQSGATGAGLINDGTLVGVFVANQGSTVSVPFTNGGSIAVQSGNLSLLGGGTYSGTILGASGTGITLAGSVMTLTPTASITADSFGIGPSTLNLEISGPASGTGFPAMTVNNTASIAGGLNVELLNGFTPSLGEQFTIINNQGSNPITGTFAGLAEGAVFSSGPAQFQISYKFNNGRSVVLTTIAVASAGGPYTMSYGGNLALNASSSADVYGDALTYSWTINGHANAATGVQPVLTWAQLQALGVNSIQTFTVSVQVSDGRGPAFTSLPASVTVVPTVSVSGIVWEDFNDDGQVDFGEKGIAGVAIALTGTDDLGHAVNLSQLTDADGAYVFLNLRPGNYHITETQPSGYLQGIDTVGTAGGSLVATDQFFVQLAAGVNGLNYNYGEQPPATGSVKKGQTAGIGFWNNKNGQALILALPVGPDGGVADWLARTLPNMFGVHAGSSNLTGKSNACVAALFQQDFVMKGPKLDAQVLATALSVYATNATLDSTKVAVKYGFTVSGTGLGTDTVNVGRNGDAFGVANNSVLTVLDLLKATDAQAVNGMLYNGNARKRTEANDVYIAINQAGNIG